MSAVETFGWLVLAFPLLGTVLIGLTKDLTGDSKVPGYIGTLAIAGAFASAVGVFVNLQGLDEERRQVVSVGWDYARTVGLDAQVSILLDPLSTLMILVVSGVSMLIHLYSIAYMDSDRGYTRFFAYLNFFVFSMLLLILAANFLLLVVGWAFVGAASYLLVSFWYRRNTATRAGTKAFVINVVGDIGIYFGAFFIFKSTGSLDFLTSFNAAQGFSLNDGELVAGLIGLLIGAFAKSAQVPLHTWLPDAMEGPTPVSALIHAATMVTAGVYLIARMHPLFERAPDAAAVAAVGGAVTLLVAATTALVVTDLKRVIAYSTMSQIGYMTMAVGSGAYTAGVFHLMTHAFFKALLFMAAGSVIAAMASVQDLDRMGGFRKAMPFTYAAFIVGGLALSGVPPFSGFFSKDEILADVATQGGWHIALAVAGYIGALLTPIYTFRMIFRAFHGKPVPQAQELIDGHLHHEEHHTNPVTGELEDTDVGFPGAEHHIAEREWPMKTAMGVLALLATVAGLLQVPHVTDSLAHFLEPTFGDSKLDESLNPSDQLVFGGLIAGAVLSLSGIGIAFLLWGRPSTVPTTLRSRLRPLHTLFSNRWYFDALIDGLIVRPALAVGRWARGSFERLVINGVLVGGSSGGIRLGSGVVRRAQSGYLRGYASLILIGLTGLGLYFLLSAS